MHGAFAWQLFGPIAEITHACSAIGPERTWLARGRREGCSVRHVLCPTQICICCILPPPCRRLLYHSTLPIRPRVEEKGGCQHHLRKCIQPCVAMLCFVIGRLGDEDVLPFAMHVFGAEREEEDFGLPGLNTCIWVYMIAAKEAWWTALEIGCERVE